MKRFGLILLCALMFPSVSYSEPFTFDKMIEQVTFEELFADQIAGIKPSDNIDTALMKLKERGYGDTPCGVAPPNRPGSISLRFSPFANINCEGLKYELRDFLLGSTIDIWRCSRINKDAVGSISRKLFVSEADWRQTLKRLRLERPESYQFFDNAIARTLAAQDGITIPEMYSVYVPASDNPQKIDNRYNRISLVTLPGDEYGLIPVSYRIEYNIAVPADLGCS